MLFLKSFVVRKKQEITAAPFNATNTSNIDGNNIKKSLYKLESLVIDEMRHWWAALLLKQYLENNYTPGGLSINKKSTYVEINLQEQ